MELLATEAWRTRLSEAEPLPDLARRASPALAADLVRERLLPPGAPVHVFRLYLAPLGLAIAEQLASPWATLDLDDDDEALLREWGDREEADAYGRLLGVFGPSFESVWLASRAEAEAVTPRTGLQTAIVPNAVGHQSRVERAARDPEGPLSLLFVGNLAYWPNIEAAEVLAERVLPAVRRLVSGPVQVMLVGRFEADSPIPGLGELEGVRAVGYADDLRAHYAAADVVVVPMSSGAGTRIKVLEAFAYGVPVVSTLLGASGLGAVDGRQLLLAEHPRDIARAIARLVDQPALARNLVEQAAALVEGRFSVEVVTRQVLDLVPDV